ncbi:hypothetical protein KSP40_PGU022353 [Platanthera guangdongensis]|uniref:Uncharacterized protein n=1 Tax=Platanthera guangdongensis TaxID=2320717 RepID=A0ABR2MRL6_9ASPA
MAKYFHSQWLVASTAPIRKPRTVAVLASGRRSNFRGLMKPERFLKLSMEKSNGYTSLAGKERRIYCNGEREGPPMEDLTEAEELVENFYRSINERNVSQLSALLTDDCIYEDALFYSPFKGKKVSLSKLRMTAAGVTTVNAYNPAIFVDTRGK